MGGTTGKGQSTTTRTSLSVGRVRVVSDNAARKIAAVASSGTATLTSTPVNEARIEARPRFSIANTAIRTGSGSAGADKPSRSAGVEFVAGPGTSHAERARLSRRRRSRRLAAATFDKAVLKACWCMASRADLELIATPVP